MHLKDIETLIFDFGNVLINIDLISPIQQLSFLMGKENPIDLWEGTPDYFYKYETGLIVDEVFINHIIADSNKPIQAKKIIQIWNSILLDLPIQRLEMLTQLKKKYNLILLSNTNSLHIKEVKKRLLDLYGIHEFENQFFDQVFYSFEIHDRKPNYSIYKKVVNKLNHDPKNALFFDDGEINVIESNRAGLPAVLHLPHWEIIDHIKRLQLL